MMSGVLPTVAVCDEEEMDLLVADEAAPAGGAILALERRVGRAEVYARLRQLRGLQHTFTHTRGVSAA